MVPKIAGVEAAPLTRWRGAVRGIFLALTLTCVQAPARLCAQTESADSLWAAGQMDEARRAYEQVLVGDMANVRANYRLGILLSWDGKLDSALVCHPYDICTVLIAREAGCIVEAPLGGKLDQPLDTTSAVAWTGYANAALARHIRPVLHRLIKKHL